MRAVDIGVGHDDHAVVAQILVAVFRARAAAERLDQVGDLLVGGELVVAGAGDVEDLAAQRQHGLAGAVARLLGRAAGGVALDDEELGAGGGVLRAVGELAGQAQLADRGLARDLASPGGGARARRRARSPIRAASRLPADCRPANGRTDRGWPCSTMRIASIVASLSLVWPTNSGSRMKTDSMPAAEIITSSLVMIEARLLPVRSA